MTSRAIRCYAAVVYLVFLSTAGAYGLDGATPFTEVASESGVEFVHFNGMTGEFYFPENVGAGVAVFDFDNDGDLDLYLRQGIVLGRDKKMADALFPLAEGVPLGDRLFRNDSEGDESSARWRFVDVTDSSGIRAESYGMGVAAGDYDGDGAIDLYLTNFDANQLWKNNGDGSFSNVTDEAGVGAEQWSVSASFVDYDGDQRLDLYVGNYVDFAVSTHKPCYSESSALDYCGPRSYNPQPDRLFRNNGDGTFDDVSAVAGVAKEFGGALGVITADFDLDGSPDIYVANDQVPNQLWINDGGGRFTNEAVLAGVAVNMDGAPEASMGVDAADFDGDGDDDLFLTHLRRQTNTIYVNEGDGWFSDRTLETGLAAASFPYTSFGTAWIDYDNDGLLDLLIANGAVQTIEELALANDPYPLHQPNQLFRNLGGGRFEDVSAAAGAAFELSEVTRGAAFGDLDNDGDTDVALTNNNGPARLLRNDLGNRRAWAGLRLLDARAKSDVRQARVRLRGPTGDALWRRVRVDGGYASSHDGRILVGLGTTEKTGLLRELRVEWRGGRASRYLELPVERYLNLYESSAESSP